MAALGRAVLPLSALNTLRLRGGFGVSGQQPGTTDALRFFNPVAGKKDGVGTTGVTFGSLGNADLKPERSREFELGFDAGLFKDRVSVELTYYNKLTKDALIQRDVAPSLGASASPVRQPRRGSATSGFEAGDQHPDHRQAQHRLGPDAERLDHEEQDPGAGRRA